MIYKYFIIILLYNKTNKKNPNHSNNFKKTNLEDYFSEIKNIKFL